MSNEIDVLRATLAGWDEYEGWDHWLQGTCVTLPFFGRVEVVEYTPGSSDYDDGVPTVLVFKVTNTNPGASISDVRYFRKSGYANSHAYGINWSGEFREVRPKEKVAYEYV